MTDQLSLRLSLRQQIIDRLGCPEPELPGVQYIGTSNRWSDQLCEIFDRMCMSGFDDLDLFERALAKLEQIREHDYGTFYLGRSELMSLYPIHYDPPSEPPTEIALEPEPRASWSPLTIVALTDELAS